MKLHRILTQNVNKTRTIGLIQKFFDSFTVIEATGYWQGQAEDTLIIEIATKKSKEVSYLAERIQYLNSQDSVLVQQINAKMVF